MPGFRISGGSALIGATAVFAVGMLVGGSLGPERPASADAGLDEVTRIIEENSLNRVDARTLRESAVYGMLSAIDDPWAEYEPAGAAPAQGAIAGDEAPLHVTAEFLANGVRYVRIDSFAPGVGTQVGNALSGDKTGIILDLRENRGGLLDEAVAVASHFLDGGRVVSFTAAGRPTSVYDARPGGDSATAIVVVVDTLTASSAEIVAAALQERGRAVIIGQRTFGKGTVQEPFILSDGSRIKITVGRYLTPSGREIDGTGVTPDIEVPSDEARERAMEVLEGLMAGVR